MNYCRTLALVAAIVPLVIVSKAFADVDNNSKASTQGQYDQPK
jgi:hypothetical protein